MGPLWRRFQAAPAAVLTLLAVAASASCRFLPNEPYWIEPHGTAQGVGVTAWPSGALAIGTDRHLYRYPGAWSRPWLPHGPTQNLRAIAASRVAVYAILDDGQVARFADNTWTPLAGSASWGASGLAATEDDRLFVLVGGRARLVEGVDLKEGPCGSLVGTSISAVGSDDLYVLDAAGNLHQGRSGRCDRVDAPVPLQRVAATKDRLVAVGKDGSVWRRRDGAWKVLPEPRKFRPGRRPYTTRARDVAVSPHSTWIMDDEGHVFLLSAET